MDIGIALLGSSRLDPETGVTLWQSIVPVANDVDVETLGELDVYQSLGISSNPWPKDDDGAAEAIYIRDVGGRTAVCVAARDPRFAKIVGKLGPGDTAVHSCDPSQSAQLQLKGKKRQATLLTTDSAEETVMLNLDGKNDKVQLWAFGYAFEFQKGKGISLTNGEASILLQGQEIYLNGNVRLQGMTPGLALMQGPTSGSPGGPASVPLFPVTGVGK
jgi:hypothetical protein